MLIKYIKLTEDAKPFEYSREGDACMDMYAAYEYFLYPNSITLIKTNIALEIPEGYEGVVRGRSGLAFKGIFTHVGTIDSNYRGNIGVILHNLYDEVYHVSKYDRIAQITIKPVEHINLILAEKLSETERGESGYGSSGK